ncbi:hypothetical protein TVAG_265820 [Trichomonas vaginalis G3]|uniref:Uncharacterized protein n=1 Tax=Trichomonas vaginalis (strain ATCC PRA-98 / G3) TaxID=412133 RepID=A2F2H9_TRIV3|nr:hypothetical protein TVAGG3_0980400 [Trichomonas vaginalis G3]EAY00879.1 hypothetical protein TVAG_265820 [Trichomonas vaginalis G3]KAI5489248.1 hypothetical protein TVAGG3_0980400 [Trichomonas vaginalis G3]|eukprot:XP_001313808.1 hypothetical protein [Trichomonas vaginalis G3]
MLDQIDPQIFKDIIETRRINKHKRNTAQSFRDHNRIVSRMEQIGIKVDFVSACLEKICKDKLTTAFLLLIANSLISKLNIPIDRLAKRNRTALLCWYAEHWEEVSPYIPDIVSVSKKESNKSNLIFNPFDISQLLNHH